MLLVSYCHHMTKLKILGDPEHEAEVVDITADQARENVKKYNPPIKHKARLLACLNGIAGASKSGRNEYFERWVSADETAFITNELAKRGFKIDVTRLYNDLDEYHVGISW